MPDLADLEMYLNSSHQTSDHAELPVLLCGLHFQEYPMECVKKWHRLTGSINEVIQYLLFFLPDYEVRLHRGNDQNVYRLDLKPNLVWPPEIRLIFES